jgi:hypothetical protein
MPIRFAFGSRDRNKSEALIYLPFSFSLASVKGRVQRQLGGSAFVGKEPQYPIIKQEQEEDGDKQSELCIPKLATTLKD